MDPQIASLCIVVMKRYTYEELKTLPPDHVFSKITNKMMKCVGNTRSQNKVKWAEEWLKRREDKMPSTRRISQSISIQDAFNQLSNEQLNKWINIYRKKVHYKVNKIDVMNKMGRDKANKIVSMDCV